MSKKLLILAALLALGTVSTVNLANASDNVGSDEDFYTFHSNLVVRSQPDGSTKPYPFDLKPIDGFDEQHTRSMYGGESYRSENQFMILKILDYRGAWNSFQTDYKNFASQLPELQSSEKWNVTSNGFPQQACNRLYSDTSFIMKNEECKLGFLILEARGAIEIITSQMNLNSFIWPLSCFSVKSNSHTCPLKEITFYPANNQLPMRICGRVSFSKNLSVNLEIANVSRIDVTQDKTLMQMKKFSSLFSKVQIEDLTNSTLVPSWTHTFTLDNGLQICRSPDGISLKSKGSSNSSKRSFAFSAAADINGVSPSEDGEFDISMTEDEFRREVRKFGKIASEE